MPLRTPFAFLLALAISACSSEVLITPGTTSSGVAAGGAGGMMGAGGAGGMMGSGGAGGMMGSGGAGGVNCGGSSKYAGTPLWSKRFGGAKTQIAPFTAIDTAGNILITGNVEGTVDFGGGSLTSVGIDDIFAAKLDPDGNHLWSKRFGDADLQYTYASAIDTEGNVLISGFFDGTVDFGGGPLTSAGAGDILLAKLDPSGNHLWSKRFGDAIDQGYNVAIAVDAAGNVLLAGGLLGTMDFGGGPLTYAGNQDIFIGRFDHNGNHLWSKRFGTPGYPQYAQATAVDAAGGLLITGTFSGTVDFGGGPLASAGYDDIFVVKLDPNGNHLWSKQFGDASYQYGWAMAVDAANNVVLTTRGYGTVDFGGGPLTTAGSYDIFLAKLDPNGNHLWSRRFGDANAQNAGAPAVDATGNVLLTGSFAGTVDFGNGPLTSAGNSDIFLAKLNP